MMDKQHLAFLFETEKDEAVPHWLMPLTMPMSRRQNTLLKMSTHTKKGIFQNP